MDRPMIVILSGSGDWHGHAVAQALNSKGAEVRYWCAADYPTRSDETIRFERNRRVVTVRGPEVVIDRTPDTVWYRRPAVHVDNEQLHPADRDFAQLSCTVARRSTLDLLAPSAFWVNPPDAANRANRKPLQQFVAASAGLATPDSVYTNDPVEIRDFIRAHGGRIIFKPLTGQPWCDDDHVYTSFSTIIDEAALVADPLLRAAPGIYQEYVEKEFELRVTVIGRQHFALQLLSQQTANGRIDWRLGHQEMQMRPFTLPPSVAAQCHAVVDALGLVFGCIDLIVRPGGEYVFLEINQMGQFLFVENDGGLPVLDAFSEMLLQGRPDYDWSEERVTVRYADIRARVEAEADAMIERHVQLPDNLWDERVTAQAS